MGGEGRYKRYEQDQGALFPSYLSEALDQSDPAFFINDVVDSPALEAFEQRYSRLGVFFGVACVVACHHGSSDGPLGARPAPA